jgi:hypothetical protein
MVNISACNNPNVKLGCAIQRVRERYINVNSFIIIQIVLSLN